MLQSISSAPPAIRAWGEPGNWVAYDPETGAYLVRPNGVKRHRGKTWYVLVVPFQPAWAIPPRPDFAFEKRNLGADTLEIALQQAAEWLPILVNRIPKGEN